jgi:acyl transferase domain-containing protein/acyl carrier protein
LNDEIFGKNAKVSISAFNTPCDIVISGENDAIKIIADWWMRKGAVIKYLQVTRAFHTPMMQPMLQAFEETTREIHYSIPSIPIVSNVTGKIETEILANSSYWVQHVCSAVQFSAGMLDLASKGCTHWIEVGPHPILITMGQQMLEGGAWLPSLHRQIDAEKQFLEVLGTYYTAGASIDWLRWTHARLGLDPANPLPKPQACLPAYPFQTQRYWFESISDSSLKNKTFTEQNLHPILQEAIPLAACNAFYFKGQVSIKTHRLIEEHQIFDMPIWPMSASIDALIAAAQLSSNDALPEWTINDFEIVRPMFFETEQKNILLQANVTGATFERKRNIELLAKIEGNKETWQVYARGNVRPSCDGKGGIWVDTTALKKNLKEKDTTDFYQKCQKMGLGYKPGFQGLKKMWLAGNEAMAHVEISDISSKKSTLQASTSYPHHAHPAMLDACLHVAIPFMQRLGLDSQMVLLPTSIQRLTLYRSLPFSVDVHCMWLGIQGPGRYGLQFDIFDRTGRRVATLQGVQFSISHRASLLKNRHIAQQGELALYQTNWRVLETSSKSCKDKKNQEIEGIWLVLSRNSKRLKELVFACKNKHQKMNFYADSLVVIGVEQGKSLIWNGREKIFLDIFKESDWAALFDMLKQRGVALRGIWLDAIEDEGQVSIESPVASAYALSQICLLTLKQFFIVYSEAIDKQHSYPDIVLCTRGAVAPPESVNLGQRLEIDNISQSVVHGLAKAMAMEMPNLKCLHVDIDPLSTIEKTPAAEAFDTWSQVTELLNICPGSAQLALRGKKSWVAQIEPMLQFQRSESSIKIDPNGIYLVTGGCRGLGLATAQWLVEKGAKYLVLIGKSISPEALVAVQNMKATGVNVEITFANVADFDSMKKGLDAALQAMQTEKKLDLKLKGIIHAAGTTRDATLVNMAWQDFSEVLDSKIKGSWNIHRLSQEKHAETLDFFILFSSIVSMTGNIGQINYVAGCAFMDSLASYRRQRGYPATSINWGYWSEIGLAARRSLSTHMAEIGVAGIETVRGLKTLEELMSINPVQAGAAQIDWLRLKKKLCPGLPSLLLDAIAKKSTDENEKTKKIEPINQKNWLQNSEISMDSAWKKSLTDMPTVQAKTQLLAYLLKCISSVLKHTQNQKTQLASNFANVTLNQIGVDSLMALEIRNNIHQSLSIHVSVSLLMTGATVNEIIDVIYGQFIAHHLMQKTLIPDLPSQAMEEITL